MNMPINKTQNKLFFEVKETTQKRIFGFLGPKKVTRLILKMRTNEGTVITLDNKGVAVKAENAFNKLFKIGQDFGGAVFTDADQKNSKNYRANTKSLNKFFKRITKSRVGISSSIIKGKSLTVADKIQGIVQQRVYAFQTNLFNNILSQQDILHKTAEATVTDEINKEIDNLEKRKNTILRINDRNKGECGHSTISEEHQKDLKEIDKKIDQLDSDETYNFRLNKLLSKQKLDLNIPMGFPQQGDVSSLLATKKVLKKQKSNKAITEKVNEILKNTPPSTPPPRTPIFKTTSFSSALDPKIVKAQNEELLRELGYK